MNIKKERKKRSKIWLLPDSDFKDLIKRSCTVSEVMRFFEIKNHGGNYRTLQARIKKLNIETSHFYDKNKSSNLSRLMTKERLISEVLVKNSKFNRFHLKKYLIAFNLLEYLCKKCENSGEWMDSTLSLQLEHINGDNEDNQIENLCFLCPNCHSQTDTFAGKKRQ